MNKSSRQMFALVDDDELGKYSDLGLEKSPASINGCIYQRAFGKGTLLLLQNNSIFKYIYKLEWDAEISDADTKIILLIDVTEFESSKNLEEFLKQ